MSRIGIKKFIELFSISLLLISVFVVWLDPVKTEAFNEKRTRFGSIKSGKTNQELSLTNDYDTAVYDLDVNDYSAACISVKAEKATGDICVRLTYSSYESAALIKETVSPENGKISWKNEDFGLLRQGKYYLIVSAADNGVTSGKISVKVDLKTYKLSDKEGNNTFTDSQYQAIDGTPRNYYMAKLTTWGIPEDDQIDCLNFNLYEKGLYIGVNTQNDFVGGLRMELHKQDDSGGTVYMYGYDVKRSQKLKLTELSPGKYCLKFNWSDSSSEEKNYSNLQVMYDVTLAPCLELEKVSISKKNVTLGLKGGVASSKLTVKKYPENAAVKPYEWVSSNTKVVTVKDGSLKAVSAGKATVTCTVEGLIGGSRTCTCDVVVKKQTVTLSSKSITLDKGKTESLKATVSPKESVSWYSDDKSIVTVDKKGQLKAVKAGKTTVYAKTKSGIKSATCSVLVKDPEAEKKKEQESGSNGSSSSGKNQSGSTQKEKEPATTEEVVLKAGVGAIDVGFKTKITRTGGPADGQWSVGDELEVVSSDSYSIVVRGLKVGKATVTFSGKGVIKSITIIVE